MHDTIVTAPGSLGDVNPLLAIARVLRDRGHRVLFVAAERYLHLAQRAGLETHSLVAESEFSEMVNNAQMWHPRHGVRLIFEHATDGLQAHYQWLEQNCQPGRTLLVSHVLDFAGRIYRDRHPSTRFLSVIPAPAPLRSTQSPPRLSGYAWERWYPKVAMPLAYWCADHWLDRLAAPAVNTLRQSIGLPPVRRILNQWWLSPDGVIGLFPDWFSVPKIDLPEKTQLVGFPLADSADLMPAEVADELARILERLGDARGVVFAPGTAHYQGGRFLAAAVTACQKLDLPAILISSEPSQFPKSLPPDVFCSSYLPFSQLLPRSAAIVHHGGVGTTSQAFAAGIPQLVLPMAFDQFDNAERVARLGCGDWLPMRKLDAKRLEARLDGLDDRAVRSRAIRQRVSDQPSFDKRVGNALSEFGV